MKIAVITCYSDPDYVRARVLRSALKTLPGVRPIIIKNRRRGLGRYPEVLWKLWRVKHSQKPDAYLLTFRGQEILPLVQLIIGRKSLIFDELIVPIAYATGENHARTSAVRLKHFLARRSEALYRRWLGRCDAILADTAAHAELSARTSHVNLSKYTVVPVGADETLFKPVVTGLPKIPFQVFYYSSGMQPLHGVQYVLQAAQVLKATDTIEFLIVGGKKLLRDAVAAAAQEGARVSYRPWIPFEKLAITMQESGLCLGGPFGDTPQAQHVITTKTYQILAMGLPAVIGASEASAEYFWDKQNALVVPQASAEALAEAIAWAQNHPNELNAIAHAGHKLYEQQFSQSAIARILQPLIDAIS